MQVGEMIKCESKEHAIELMQDLQKQGVETDFVYEVNGVKGLWLKVIKISP